MPLIPAIAPLNTFLADSLNPITSLTHSKPPIVPLKGGLRGARDEGGEIGGRVELGGVEDSEVGGCGELRDGSEER